MTAYQTQRLEARMKPDRIDRALELIESGKVKSLGHGRYHVESKRQPAGYVCTAIGCTCFDYVQKGTAICKHIWAGPGGHIVRYIGRARKAETIEALQELMNEMSVDRTMIPRVFAVVAREEFMVCRTLILATTPTQARPWPGYEEWADSVEAEQAKKEVA